MLANVTIDGKTQYWTQDQVKTKLEQLASANKKTHWICHDLTTTKSSCFGRIFWAIIKHFKALRMCFYRVDLNKTNNVLKQIKASIATSDFPDKAVFQSLYNKAVTRFNQIAPKHAADYIYTGVGKAEDPYDPSKPQDSATIAYHGATGLDLPKTLLTGKKTGTYLIRDSIDTVGAKIFMYVDGGGFINSAKLLASLSGYTHNGIYYSSLNDFIDQNQDMLKTPLPKHGLPTSTSNPKVPAKPKIHIEIPCPKLKLAETALKTYQEGTSLDDLLGQAILDNEPELALQLVECGASMDGLPKTEMTDWLQAKMSMPAATPKTLDHYALKLGYGYKTANLMVLQETADKMNKTLKTCETKVPPFKGVSDFEIWQHLMKGIPELPKLWQEFRESFDYHLQSQFLKAGSDQDAAKVPLKVSDKGLKIIEQIQEKVNARFCSEAYYTQQIDSWLKNENPDFIIVRSTGKEDSDTNSNAGGNDSVPFVKPNSNEITQAIGQVIASYFGAKSIGQRLLSGDRSLFTDAKPFVPVLLQVMIGENVGGVGSKEEDIPRSGVMFTRQKDKAEGVTLIQAGLGNNEGVVTSQVPVDSYYVGAGNYVHTVVRKKTSRFVSVHDIEADHYRPHQIETNNPSLENAHALPGGVVLDLKRIADQVSIHYSAPANGQAVEQNLKAMDMEYTVKLKDKNSSKPVIYLLQARPLQDTQGDKKAPPKTYLDLKELEKVPKACKVPADTLLDGNAYVRNVQSSDDMLFVDDLTQGLKLYMDHPDPSKIKAIVSKKTAPSTSHEAVTLRPKGVAVFVLNDAAQYAKVKQMAETADNSKPLLIDPQRGLFVEAKGVSSNSLIKNGLVSYPIPLEWSVPLRGVIGTFAANKGHGPSQGYQNELKAGMALLVQELDASIKGLSNPKYDFKKQTVRELLDILAVGEEMEARAALARILTLLKKHLNRSLKQTDTSFADMNLTTLQLFETAFKLATKEIAPALKTFKPQTLDRLYPIKFLDALIFQKPSDAVVGGFSIAKQLESAIFFKKAVELGKTQGATFSGPHAFMQAGLFGISEAAFNAECAANWNKFAGDLIKLNKSKPALYQKVMNIVESVKSMKMVPGWLNLIFNSAWKEKCNKSNAAEHVANRLDQVWTSDENTLKWLAENGKLLTQFEQTLPNWSKPEYVKKNLESMQKLFLDTFGFNPNNNKLKTRYDSSKRLGRIALLQFMLRAVSVYDTAIKSVTGSTDYPDDKKQKVKDFGQMLKPYFEMSKALIYMVPDQDWKNMMTPSMGSYVSKENYINQLTNKHNYKFGWHGSNAHTSMGFTEASKQSGAEHLECRPQFKVDALVIGSKEDLNFSAHWPNTLEEYFTTFHQNMEKVVKHLNVQNGMNASILPKEQQEFCKQMQGKFHQDMSHIGLDGNMIEVAYQIPLRQHAALITLKFDPRKPEKGQEFAVKTFGNDEHDRWDQSHVVGAFLGNLDPFSYTDGVRPKLLDFKKAHREGAEFSLHLPANMKNSKDFVDLMQYTVKTMTMGSCGGAYPLLEKLKGFAGSNWDKIKPDFFADSFYLTTEAMNQNAGNTQFLVNAAAHSLIGLARLDLKDYTRSGSNIKNLNGYLGDSKYKYVPNNSGHNTNSVVLASMLHLIKGLQDAHGKAYAAIQMVLQNADVKKKLPEVVKALEAAVASFKTPIQQFNDWCSKGNWLQAIVVAWQNNDPKMLQQVTGVISSNKTNKTWLIDLTKELYGMGLDKAAEKLVIPHMNKLDSSVVKDLEKLKEVEKRKDHYVNLANNVAKLQNLVGNFDGNYKEVLPLCASTLIGLTQCDDFQNQSYAGFTNLGPYLGVKKYSYIYDNVHTTTTKLRKGAPLYLIKGFESSNSDVRKAAFEAFGTLVNDYLLAGKNSTHAAHIRDILFAISRGYYDAEHDKTKAIKMLARVWQKNSEMLNGLASAHTRIPLKELLAVK